MMYLLRKFKNQPFFEKKSFGYAFWSKEIIISAFFFSGKKTSFYYLIFYFAKCVKHFKILKIRTLCVI